MNFSAQSSQRNRDGTNQQDRLLPALSNTFVKIDERTIEDFLEFCYAYAEQIRYFNLKNQADGDWTQLLESISTKEKRKELIKKMAGSPGDIEPSLALLLTFLKLYVDYYQKDLNQLTKQHLAFHFENVLKFQKKDAQPDKVHVLFQLSKHYEKTVLPVGTRLDAKTDALGNKRVYVTQRDVTLSKASIDEIKSLYVDPGDNFRILAAPVANSVNGQGPPFKESDSQWSPFGESQIGKGPDAATMQETASRTGFALASPILLLKEGTRRITLDISLEVNKQTQLQIDKDDFEASATGEEGWFPIAVTTATPSLQNGTPTSLKLTLELGPEALAFLPYQEDIHAHNLNTRWPVLKVTLTNKRSNFVYDELRKLKFKEAKIEVDVKGIREIIAHNDQSPVDTTHAFLPFTNKPAVGSSFYFGNHEVFSKKLDSLSVNMTWADLPDESFENHYNEYENPYKKKNNFEVTVSYLHQRLWQLDNGNTVTLFNLVTESNKPTRDIVNRDLSPHSMKRDYNLESFDQFGPEVTRGFIRFQLNTTDFGHSIFPGLYTEKAILKASEPNNHTLPNPPYTPRLNSLTIDYTSSVTVSLEDAHEPERFFHIEPYGTRSINPQESEYIFSQLDQGTLYLGIAHFSGPSQLSVLFQVAEGSADPTQELSREAIQWSYLVNEDWIPFEPTEILSDTTLGLQTSGIIVFDIPEKASPSHQRMPNADGAKHWLRATIDQDAKAANKLIAIHAQTVTAKFLDQKNDPSHYRTPLPKDTIRKLVTRTPNIKSVSQPYTSFDGRPAEEGEDIFGFYTRTSERLRHKQRAITLWDYEHLLLEVFPSIYKAKCIGHTDSESYFAPGTVTMIVIPDLRNKNAVNTLEPKASRSLLHEIREYLSSYVPAFVQVDVSNPTYEQLTVDFIVGFHEGIDEGFHTQQLNDAIVRFLSPWAFDKGQDIAFGGCIYQSDILKFVEDLDYVDYVTNFKLHTANSKDIEVAEPSSARSILVSVERHNIQAQSAGNYSCSGAVVAGIGSMTIGDDFSVA